MHPHPWRSTALAVAGLAGVILASACSGPAAVSTAASASASASALASGGPTGPANLDAPADVEAGAEFEVAWTGPDAQGDYVTIVAASAAKWTDEPYFYTTAGSPSPLVAPTAEGAYALWYVSGADETILARRAIRVTPFSGALLAPDEVEAGSQFDVAWNGPDGPGDYVTIVAIGTDKWTNESYFYTNVGPTGSLQAPVEDGQHEIWYVAADGTIFARRPITLTPYQVTLEAPAQVARGAQFEVTWTGPDGISDYITIVLAGAADTDYGDYKYTRDGSPSTLTAPDLAGNYEIRYVSDRVDIVFKSTPIRVT